MHSWQSSGTEHNSVLITDTIVYDKWHKQSAGLKWMQHTEVDGSLVSTSVSPEAAASEDSASEETAVARVHCVSAV